MSPGRRSTPGMATFVLVHGGNISTGTWNRFTVGDEIHTHDGMMGGRCWDGTGVRFSRAGRRGPGMGAGVRTWLSAIRRRGFSSTLVHGVDPA
ncbi:MAG TPA: hypothetical protein PLG61_09365 [Methanoregulaceae archaeon]|nr:hypothetical protein [Methanoregulaceae archaeon]